MHLILNFSWFKKKFRVLINLEYKLKDICVMGHIDLYLRNAYEKNITLYFMEKKKEKKNTVLRYFRKFQCINVFLMKIFINHYKQDFYFFFFSLLEIAK